MLRFGICGRMTDFGIQPAELARWAEAQGFESLWFGEHTHAPDPDRVGRKDPEAMDQLYDPCIVIAVAAAVTQTLKLGVSVALLPLHHPISYAKTLATLDRICGGRFILGVGAGVIVREVEDFGIPFGDRWKALREHLSAIRTIWANDVAEFDGRFVRFGPLRSWPKPLRQKGPLVLEGAFSTFAARRIADYADGWIAWDGMAPEKIKEIIDRIRQEVMRAGRNADDLDLTIVIRVPVDAAGSRERIGQLHRMGFGRIVLLMSPNEPDLQWRELAWFKSLMNENATYDHMRKI
jgi:probable F420-dependent oxidoreductase